ncbi:hypothetical protein J3F84DRAFT_343274 [Trichoderma pleuroticola]
MPFPEAVTFLIVVLGINTTFILSSSVVACFRTVCYIGMSAKFPRWLGSS